MALEWYDVEGRSILSGDELDSQAHLWYDNRAKCWQSNTPPIFGSFDTLEAGKTAIVRALKDRALKLHTALCELGERETAAK